MRFRNILLSFFVIFAFGLALVHAEDDKKAPRGPKVTDKVRMLSEHCLNYVYTYIYLY